MISVKSLKADISFKFDFVNISFSIEDTTEDISKYRFDLYRSNGESDKFEPIFFNIKNMEFKDYSVSLYNPANQGYCYKIRIFNLNTNEWQFSDYVTISEVDPDIYCTYLNCIYETYLNTVLDSRDMYFLKKVRGGERCNLCYDDVYGSRQQDKCPKCYGTGYKDGFYPAITIKVNFANISSTTENLQPTGAFKEESNIQLWTLGYPTMQEGDMIVDSITKERYVIKSWQPSVKNGFVIRQTVICDDIPETSIYNKVPLRLEGINDD